MSEATQRRRDWWIEPLLAASVAAGLLWALGYLLTNHYLPQPFFYEAFDTWMDWFNPAYWAHQPGAYDSWGTIYPPLSFVFLKFATYSQCYTFSEQYTSRDCDWYGVATLHLLYLINIVLTAKVFLKIDRRTALPRAFALTAGLPMLFALERGNLILLCYTCLLLAYGPLVKSAKWRWFFAGCAVNLKIYLVGTLFVQLVSRRWRQFEGAALATVVVYLVTFAIIGTGTPSQVLDNMGAFALSQEVPTILDLWYTMSYKPLIALMDGRASSIVNTVGSGPIELWSVILPFTINGTIILIGLAAVAAAFRPTVTPLHRLIFLSIASAVITSETGGYTQILILLFVFMEPWRGFGRIFAIVVGYILCIPADVPLYWVPPVTRESFLYGGPVTAQYAVGFGPFIRPGLVIALAISLSLVTIRDVWKQLRLEGWRVRDFGKRAATDPLLAAPGAASTRELGKERP